MKLSQSPAFRKLHNIDPQPSAGHYMNESGMLIKNVSACVLFMQMMEPTQRLTSREAIEHPLFEDLLAEAAVKYPFAKYRYNK